MEEEQVVSALEAGDDVDADIDADLGDGGVGFCDSPACHKFTGS